MAVRRILEVMLEPDKIEVGSNFLLKIKIDREQNYNLITEDSENLFMEDGEQIITEDYIYE